MWFPEAPQGCVLPLLCVCTRVPSAVCVCVCVCVSKLGSSESSPVEYPERQREVHLCPQKIPAAVRPLRPKPWRQGSRWCAQDRSESQLRGSADGVREEEDRASDLFTSLLTWQARDIRWLTPIWNLAVGRLCAQPMLQISLMCPLCLFPGYFDTFLQPGRTTLVATLSLDLALSHLGIFSSTAWHCLVHSVYVTSKVLLSRQLHTPPGTFSSQV